METKTCSTCGQEKSVSQFELRNPKTGRRRGQCNACRYQQSSEYQASYRLTKPSQVYRGLVDTSKCALCDFPYPDVHHLNHNHDDNRPENLVALCPNHHRLVHVGDLVL
jgi:hypothetical protein